MPVDPPHPLVDPSLLEFIVDITPAWVGFLLVFLTYLGSVYVIVPLVVVAYWHDPDRKAPWIAAVVGYYGLMAGIKSLNSADRPAVGAPVSEDPFPELFVPWYEHATAISTTSFPSGNVMAATIVAGLFVIDTRVSTVRRRFTSAALVVGLVAYTRLGLGVHYPVDVVGGVFLGIVFLGAYILIRERTVDETAALFALAAVLAFAALWLQSGVLAPPSVDGLIGSNRPVAFGAALGGLFVWLSLRDREDLMNRLAASPLSIVGLAAGFGAMYLVHSAITHPIVTTLWAAVVFGTVIAVPWIAPGFDRPTIPGHEEARTP